MKRGWEVKKLGEVCEVIAGQSPASKFYNSKGIGLPFYQGKKEFKDKYIGKPTTWSSEITKEAFEGDILMSVRAPVGPVNFSTQHICIGRGLAAIRANKSIDKEFLFNFLLKHENEIVGNAGAVFNSIDKTQIGNILIPIPPLPEQKRIVAILGHCFNTIDKAKANVERNLQNAKELFQSQLNQIFSQKGEGWVEKKLGEVCEVIAGQSPKGEYYNSDEEGFPFYQGKKEFTNKYIGAPTTWTTMVTKEAYEGDILLSVRAPVGPINFSTQLICIGRGLAAIRAGETINREYLFYFLLKHENEIVGNAGAVFNSINKTQIENIIILMMPLSEQEKIVKALDRLKIQTQSLESHYEQELNALDELKKSILQKAFKGELTAKDEVAA